METSNAVIAEVDLALKQETSTQTGTVKEPQQPAAPHSKLPALLRKVGAALLLAAGGTFLFQGWGGMDSLGRLYSFLCFTGLLGLTGLFCGLQLKENKGARVLLGVALVLVPVTFLQLGALIYSFCGGLTPRFSAFILTAPNLLGVGVAGIAVLAVSLPLVFLAFSSLARTEALALLAGYGLGNLALLIPVRDPNLVALVALVLFAGALLRDLQYFRHVITLKTLEGKLARVALFVPFALLIGRNLVLYAPTTLFSSVLFGALAGYMFFAVPAYSADKAFGRTAQGMSILPLGISWAGLVHALFFLGLPWQLNPEFRIPLTCLPFSAMLVGLSFISLGDGIGYRKLAGWIAVGAVALQLMTFGSLFSSFLCIVTAVGALVLGTALEEKGLFFAGSLGLVVGIGYHLRYALDVAQLLSPWVSLAIFGILLVLGSSYLERNAVMVLERVKRMRKAVAGWR